MTYIRLIIFVYCSVIVWVKAAPVNKTINVINNDKPVVPVLHNEMHKIKIKKSNIFIDVSHLNKKKFYGGPSKATGKKVAKWSKKSKVNPEELGEYAEGDIRQTKSSGRNGLAALSYRWFNGIVPYTISTDFSKYPIFFLYLNKLY